jgi:hypothetical protein
MKTKLREILEKLVNQGWFGGAFDDKDDLDKAVDHALTEILSLVKEYAPVEKPKVKGVEPILIETGNEVLIGQWAFVNGFNAGVKQFLANIEGEK